MELGFGNVYHRRTQLRGFRSTSRTTSLPKNPESKPPPTTRTPFEVVQCDTENFGGVEVVEKVDSLSYSNFPPKSADFYNDRCVEYRMGSSPWKRNDCGSLVTRADELAYKLKRDVRSKIDDKTEYRESNEQECVSSIRQQDCRGLHKQGGRHEIAGPSSTSRGLTDSDKSEKHFDNSEVHSRNFQYNGGQSLPEQANPGLALVTRNSDQDLSIMGCTRDRSICNTPVSSGSSVCSPISCGSTSLIHRRIQSGMDLQVGLDFSSTILNTKSVTTSELSGRSVYSNNPKMAQGILAPGLEKQSHEASLPHSRPGNSLDRPANESSSTPSERTLFGGLENSGWLSQISNGGIEDRKLLESSWRESTLKTYRAPWKRWIKWALSNKISVNNPSPQNLALYLSYLHREEKMA